MSEIYKSFQHWFNDSSEVEITKEGEDRSHCAARIAKLAWYAGRESRRLEMRAAIIEELGEKAFLKLIRSGEK